MNRFSTVVAWVALAAVAVFVAMNWATMTQPATLNIGPAQVVAPLGPVQAGVGVAPFLAGLGRLKP